VVALVFKAAIGITDIIKEMRKNLAEEMFELE
jgi:hypothetical protein